MNTQIKETFKFAFPRTFPVLTGFLVMGIAYGVLMASKGYSPFWILLISATALCGSMQFVAIPFFAGMFAPMQVFLLSLMVNARHFFMVYLCWKNIKGQARQRRFLSLAYVMKPLPLMLQPNFLIILIKRHFI